MPGQSGIFDYFKPRPPVATPTSKQRINYDALAKDKERNKPLWMQLMEQLVDVPIGAVQGMLGSEPTDAASINEGKLKDWAKFGGEVATAGIPFGAYKKLGKVKPQGLFHGSRTDYDMIDRAKFDESDIMGDKFHAAENPDYAGKYALGEVKHHNTDLTGAHTKLIEPEAKNVLDLVDPNSDDISQILSFADDKQRANLINQFKDYRSGQQSFFDQRHYPLGVPDSPATRAVAEKLKISPQGILDSPFDAVRYNDMAEKSWAIPVEKTRIKSPISGAYLSEELPKPIRVIRDPNPMRESTPGTGLQLSKNWQSPVEAKQNYLKKPKKKYDDYGNENIWEEGPNPLTKEQQAKDLAAKEGAYPQHSVSKEKLKGIVEKAIAKKSLLGPDAAYKKFQADLAEAGDPGFATKEYGAIEKAYIESTGGKYKGPPNGEFLTGASDDVNEFDYEGGKPDLSPEANALFSKPKKDVDDIDYNTAQAQEDLWNKSINWDNLDPPITRPEESKKPLFEGYGDMLPSAPKFSTRDLRSPAPVKPKPQKFSKEWYKESGSEYQGSPEQIADAEKVNKTIAANKAEANKPLTFSSEVAHLEPKLGKTYTIEKPDGKTFTHTIFNQEDMDYLKKYVNDYKVVENQPFGSLPPEAKAYPPWKLKTKKGK